MAKQLKPNKNKIIPKPKAPIKLPIKIVAIIGMSFLFLNFPIFPVYKYKFYTNIIDRPKEKSKEPRIAGVVDKQTKPAIPINIPVKIDVNNMLQSFDQNYL